MFSKVHVCCLKVLSLRFKVSCQFTGSRVHDLCGFLCQVSRWFHVLFHNFTFHISPIKLLIRYSLFVIRYSLFAIRYSLFVILFSSSTSSSPQSFPFLTAGTPSVI